MPKRTTLEIDINEYQFRNRALRMNKAYTEQNYQSSTILTDDVFPYIEFYFTGHKKNIKYTNPMLKPQYGDPKQYHYSFYWKQATIFYNAAKELPIEASPLASYYCMLNAAKAYIVFRSHTADDFVEYLGRHGLCEDKGHTGENLDTIYVKRQKGKTVFQKFGNLLEPNFDALWAQGDSWSLKKLLYNLAYLHRAYVTTYTKPRGKKIVEQFIPLNTGNAPAYHKGNDGNLYLLIGLDRKFFPNSITMLPSVVSASVADAFYVDPNNRFTLISKHGARRNSDSISKELKDLNKELRRKFQYIKSTKRLWYLKQTGLNSPDILNVNSMLISMAVMHRFSEIVRYKPEQLARLMQSEENWLIHEFLTLALDQFIDEIAAEITGQEIMSTGVKAE